MNGGADRATDALIAARLAATWPAFFARFGRLTPIQRQAIGPILDGSDAIVTAPTASGKTEAVCAPLIERWHKRQRWMILYVSPTRALVNDLFARLTGPVDAMGYALARRTGDHNQRPPEWTNLLLTTPESFDSLLCRARTESGHLLDRVCAVVLDEVHLLYGTARGEQLRWLLARLRRLREYTGAQPPQVVALSATVDNPAGIVATFAPQGMFINVPGGRTIERIGVAETAGSLEQQLPAYIEGLASAEKILVFCNSRKRVDSLAQRFKAPLESLKYAVRAHHGSLSRKIREEAEEAARKERKLVLFSSSTLEVGVDIGDIDLVVLDGPPPDIMSLLQRIGRGNRRTGHTRVMACARSVTESLVQAAMLQCAEQGYLGARERGPHTAVARQQIASFVLQRATGQRSRNQLVQMSNEVRPNLDAGELIQHLVNTEELLLTSDALRLGDIWQEAATSGAIHSNIESNPGQSVEDDKSGDEIATGVKFKEGPAMKIAGRLLQVRDWDNFRVLVREVSKKDLAEATWNYVVSPRLRGAGQADAVKRFLNIPNDLWPVVMTRGGATVFHFGGGRRRAVLELMQSLHVGGGLGEIDEWAMHFEGSPQKPPWLNAVTEQEVGARASGQFRKLERTLARPLANSKLPDTMRSDEVKAWLDIASEVQCARSATWQEPADSDARLALESLARELQ